MARDERHFLNGIASWLKIIVCELYTTQAPVCLEKLHRATPQGRKILKEQKIARKRCSYAGGEKDLAGAAIYLAEIKKRTDCVLSMAPVTTVNWLSLCHQL